MVFKVIFFPIPETQQKEKTGSKRVQKYHIKCFADKIFSQFLINRLSKLSLHGIIS